jgi:hypothetical protein
MKLWEAAVKEALALASANPYLQLACAYQTASAPRKSLARSMSIPVRRNASWSAALSMPFGINSLIDS